MRNSKESRAPEAAPERCRTYERKERFHECFEGKRELVLQGDHAFGDGNASRGARLGPNQPLDGSYRGRSRGSERCGGHRRHSDAGKFSLGTAANSSLRFRRELRFPSVATVERI